MATTGDFHAVVAVADGWCWWLRRCPRQLVLVAGADGSYRRRRMTLWWWSMSSTMRVVLILLVVGAAS